MNAISLILLGVVAYASAHCDSLARIRVKAQWKEAFGNANNREQIASAIFNSLFNIDPSARALFSGVNSADMGSSEFRAHTLRVATGLDRLFSQLDESDVLAADLAVLQRQHSDRGISADNYASMKNALLSVLPSSLGGCFDSSSWSDCYDVLAAGIAS